MTKKQKQEIFDAISKIGYKETEVKLMNYQNDGEIIPDEEFMTILAWFNLWYNKGNYENDLQAVISFIQANTYTNPKDSSKKKKETPLTKDFIEEWVKKFGSEPII
jgi:hypothetical protein